jgi:putative ABC transport system substrate-binding protein
MRRRDLSLAIGATGVAWLSTAGHGVVAQPARPPRIGVLAPADDGHPAVRGLREGLRDIGYVEGRNAKIEYRFAHGRLDRLPDLAQELVVLGPDVLVAIFTRASLAARAAARGIPVVVNAADAVGSGLVASLAQPGGNVTGVSTMTADIVGKQLELLRELVPAVAKVGVLWNPANAELQALQVREAETAARKLGVELRFVTARQPDEFAAAFAALRAEQVRALLVLGDPLFALHRQQLAKLIVQDRVVSISGVRGLAEEGSLAAYSPDYAHASRRAAVYVDRILKGARPADLPVEQPTAFELVINLRAAKMLGIAIPPSITVRADEVIE